MERETCRRTSVPTSGVSKLIAITKYRHPSVRTGSGWRHDDDEKAKVNRMTLLTPAVADVQRAKNPQAIPLPRSPRQVRCRAVSSVTCHVTWRVMNSSGQ